MQATRGLGAKGSKHTSTVALFSSRKSANRLCIHLGDEA